MYSVRKSRLLMFLLLAMWWFWSSTVFGISLDWMLYEKYMAAKWIDSVFGSKAKVTNMYSKALKLVKDNKIKSTYYGVDSVMAIHSEFAWCNVKKSDIINVLYDGNFEFRVAIEQTVINDTKKKVSVPTIGEITRSYKAIIKCWAWDSNLITPSKYEEVRNVLNTEYNDHANDKDKHDTMNRDTLGSDLFQNWSLDDSDYDILVDVDKLWKKMFSSFTTPTQTLFYELPKINQWWLINIWWWIWTDYNPPAGSKFAVISGGKIMSWDSSATFAMSGDTIVVLNTGVTDITNDPDGELIIDQWISDFVNWSNTSLSDTADLYSIWWNICSPWVDGGLPSDESDNLSTEDYQDFLDESINGITEPYEDKDIPNSTEITIETDWWGQITIPAAWGPNQWAEDFANGGIGWECGNVCNALDDLWEQTECNLKCADSCTSKCNWLPVYDKLACVSQCLCKEISGPVWPDWKWMENILKIKFCTVPVQNDRVSWGKKVYSIYDIFAEYKNVFLALLNWWENIKRTKPKEHFDTALSDIKFSEIISFQISFAKRSLFGNKSADTKKKELQQKNEKKEWAILGVGPNINKYVIISDVAANKALSESFNSVKAQNDRIEELKDIEKKAEVSMQNVVNTLQAEKIASFNDKLHDFVMWNYDFWNQSYLILKDFSDLAKVLKENIDSKW